MDNRFIIIIWHQAGQRTDTAIYYSLNDEETECAVVFESEEQAEKYWRKSPLSRFHAGFIVNATTSEVDWI